MPRNKLLNIAFMLAALFAAPALAAAVEAIGSAPATAAESTIPGFRQPRAQLLTGGQPGVDAWSRMGAAGVRTVINLRTDEELAGRDEAAEVAAAGLGYRHLPVAGAGDITVANALALWRLIEQADGTVVVHCASGNRVGALLALGAAQHGMDTEAAVAFGKAAGLGNAEARVREMLAAPGGR
ncbi:MAG TPA: sulfur transferase domain-containing protein [Lysobacter sp.]|nr:sulfur transferase domain-containing protein [Lysobacter sp.]